MPRAGVSMPAETFRGEETWEESRARVQTPRPVAAVPARPGAGVPGRRTITIQGRGAERNLPASRTSNRRAPTRPHERAGFRPDRAAKWAVLLGVLLVLIAATSSRGATRAPAHTATPGMALQARP